MLSLLPLLLATLIPSWSWVDELEYGATLRSCHANLDENPCSRQRLLTYRAAKAVWNDPVTTPDQRLAIEIAAAKMRDGTNVDWSAAFPLWAGKAARVDAPEAELRKSAVAAHAPVIPELNSDPTTLDASLTKLCTDNSACHAIQRKARFVMLSAYAGGSPGKQTAIKRAVAKNTKDGVINWQMAAYSAHVDFMDVPTYDAPFPSSPSSTTTCRTYVSKHGRYASTTCSSW